MNFPRNFRRCPVGDMTVETCRIPGAGLREGYKIPDFLEVSDCVKRIVSDSFLDCCTSEPLLKIRCYPRTSRELYDNECHIFRTGMPNSIVLVLWVLNTIAFLFAF